MNSERHRGVKRPFRERCFHSGNLELSNGTPSRLNLHKIFVERSDWLNKEGENASEVTSSASWSIENCRTTKRALFDSAVSSTLLFDLSGGTSSTVSDSSVAGSADLRIKRRNY